MWNDTGPLRTDLTHSSVTSFPADALLLPHSLTCLFVLTGRWYGLDHVTLDHKTSHNLRNSDLNNLKVLINNLSVDTWIVRIGQCLAEIQLF